MLLTAKSDYFGMMIDCNGTQQPERAQDSQQILKTMMTDIFGYLIYSTNITQMITFLQQ